GGAAGGDAIDAGRSRGRAGVRGGAGAARARGRGQPGGGVGQGRPAREGGQVLRVVGQRCDPAERITAFERYRGIALSRPSLTQEQQDSKYPEPTRSSIHRHVSMISRVAPHYSSPKEIVTS